jgi:hypothetical protein
MSYTSYILINGMLCIQLSSSLLSLSFPSHNFKSNRILSKNKHFITINKYNKLITLKNITQQNLNKSLVYFKIIDMSSRLVQLKLENRNGKSSLICMTKDGLRLRVRNEKIGRKRQCAWIIESLYAFRKVYYRFRSFRWNNYICVNKMRGVMTCQLNKDKHFERTLFSLLR